MAARPGLNPAAARAARPSPASPGPPPHPVAGAQDEDDADEQPGVEGRAELCKVFGAVAAGGLGGGEETAEERGRDEGGGRSGGRTRVGRARGGARARRRGKRRPASPPQKAERTVAHSTPQRGAHHDHEVALVGVGQDPAGGACGRGRGLRRRGVPPGDDARGLRLARKAERAAGAAPEQQALGPFHAAAPLTAEHHGNAHDVQVNGQLLGQLRGNGEPRWMGGAGGRVEKGSAWAGEAADWVAGVCWLRELQRAAARTARHWSNPSQIRRLT
jgi:hypothetical protein